MKLRRMLNIVTVSKCANIALHERINARVKNSPQIEGRLVKPLNFTTMNEKRMWRFWYTETSNPNLKVFIKYRLMKDPQRSKEWKELQQRLNHGVAHEVGYETTEY